MKKITWILIIIGAINAYYLLVDRKEVKSDAYLAGWQYCQNGWDQHIDNIAHRAALFKIAVGRKYPPFPPIE